MPVRFRNHNNVSFRFSGKKRIGSFIEQSFSNETGKSLSLTIIFCTDEQLLHINRQFLNHDYYTDIITFPLEESITHLEAELYISIERVRENAVAYGNTFTDELHRVIFHGVLHLIGYGDENPKQQAVMQKAENAWLRTFAKQAG